MQDRLVSYGIFLLTFYVIWYMWNQEQEIQLLQDGVLEKNGIITKQLDLIETQKEYIQLLELQYLNNRSIYNRDESPLYTQPL